MGVQMATPNAALVPAPSLVGMYTAGDAPNIQLLHEDLAECVNGAVKLVPADKRGMPNHRGLTVDKLEPAPDDIADMTIADRLCVLVTPPPACADDTAFIVSFAPLNGYGERPLVKQIAGPSADKDVGRAALLRDLGMPGGARWELKQDVPFRSADNDNEPDDDIPAAPSLPPMNVDPWSPEAAGGLLGDVSSWVSGSTDRPTPEFSTMAAVALFSGLFGRRIVGPTESGLNLYLVMLAGTGHGKDWPLKAPGLIASAMNAKWMLGPTDVTSDTAIELELRRSPVVLMPWDEFGLVLQGVTGRNAPHWATTVRRALQTLWGSSTAPWRGKANADPRQQREPIEQPTLSILGASTPQEFYDGLTGSSLNNGFVNRLLVIEPATRTKRRSATYPRKPAAELLDRLKAAVEALPGGNLSHMHVAELARTLHVVPWADQDAETRWRALVDWQDNIIEFRPEAEVSAGRVAENAIRLATIRAVSRSAREPAVSVEDVDWGFAIAHASVRVIDHGVVTRMSESPVEALRKAVTSALRKAPNQTLPYSQILQRAGVRGADTRQVAEALRWLVDVGEVVDLAGRPVGPGQGSRLRLSEPQNP